MTVEQCLTNIYNNMSRGRGGNFHPTIRLSQELYDEYKDSLVFLERFVDEKTYAQTDKRLMFKSGRVEADSSLAPWQIIFDEENS